MQPSRLDPAASARDYSPGFPRQSVWPISCCCQPGDEYISVCPYARNRILALTCTRERAHNHKLSYSNKTSHKWAYSSWLLSLPFVPSIPLLRIFSQWPSMRLEYVSTFSTKEELIEALLCSMALPGFVSLPMISSYRGEILRMCSLLTL